MFEKVNPSHPDKVADRIAGALLDIAYSKNNNPKVAIEVLLGHGRCYVINETNTHLTHREVKHTVNRLLGKTKLKYLEVKQDVHLSKNQSEMIKCGDNGIFKGVPITHEQIILTAIAKNIYNKYSYDGKYIINKDNLIICQSHAKNSDLLKLYPQAIINPLGEWTGGYNVDSGATNRKLGSDMGDAVTGGGLHGKDLSKADVSVNIYAHLLALKTNSVVNCYCAIGDTSVKVITNNVLKYIPYKDIVKTARDYIKKCGGFEKFADWGLLR